MTFNVRSHRPGNAAAGEPATVSLGGWAAEVDNRRIGIFPTLDDAIDAINRASGRKGVNE